MKETIISNENNNIHETSNIVVEFKIYERDGG